MHEDLPLFAVLAEPEPAPGKPGVEARQPVETAPINRSKPERLMRPPEPAPAPASAPPPARAADAAPQARPKAEMIPFPACRRVALVGSLASEFISLRSQYGRRSRTILVDKHFKPLRARMKRLGVPADAIRQEMTHLETAIADVVRRHDGIGRTSEPGGGSAA